MDFIQKYGPWAVVAGSAEGLGESWSRALAGRKMNLLMVDNQADKLEELSMKLKEKYGIETVTLHLDLMDNEVTAKIMAVVRTHDCKLLVYNAAYSIISPFVDIAPEKLDNFVQINVRTQILLVHAFANYLKEKNSGGGILLMSSLAGLLGMQFVAPYAGTKAFAWNFAEAIHHELEPYNIDVMACIAGATATPAYLKTKPSYGRLKPLVMKPDDVAEEALDKLGHKTLFIPGRTNRLNYFILTRLLPRKTASRIANNTMKKMYSSYGS